MQWGAHLRRLFAPVRRLVQAALGEEDLILRLPFYINGASTFVPVESKRRGYRIRRSGKKVTIKRVSPWNFLSWPRYCLKGQLTEDANGTVLVGGLRRPLPEKAFLVLWWTLYLIWLVAFLTFAVILAFKFAIAPETVPAGKLIEIGLVFGVAVAMGIFSVILHWLMRLFSSIQKRKIMVFCTVTLPECGTSRSSTDETVDGRH